MPTEKAPMWLKDLVAIIEDATEAPVRFVTGAQVRCGRCGGPALFIPDGGEGAIACDACPADPGGHYAH